MIPLFLMKVKSLEGSYKGLVTGLQLLNQDQYFVRRESDPFIFNEG